LTKCWPPAQPVQHLTAVLDDEPIETSDSTPR